MINSSNINFPDTAADDANEWIRTEFNLPQLYADKCSQYYLRLWDGHYVRAQIKDGTIIHNERTYLVHYQSLPAVVKTAKRVACSFREYNGKNYVVVKVWQSAGGKPIAVSSNQPIERKENEA